ncbi:hypothetical protein B566_EDAN015587 [Ephemera danica]|nr:hypothetical protein B566_EDAN015587 [Ephemera danica]
MACQKACNVLLGLKDHWVCIRQQSLCKEEEEEVQVSTNEASSSVSFWSAEADNWDSEEDLEDTDTDDSSVSIEEPVDPNANSAGAEGAFAVEFNNKVHIATAEIEIGDETDIVSIDTPTRTRSVSQFFVQQNCKSWGILHPEFVSSFIYVQEEFISSKQAKLNDHEMSLLQQYQQSELGGGEINLDGKGRAVEVGGGGGDITGELYGRGAEPLLLKALPRGISTQRCQACNGEMVFEMQLLSALLSPLRLTAMEELGEDTTGVLEFGTVLVYTCRDSCWSPEDAVYREEKLL